MTNEEASYILANIDRRVCDDELNEALDMAIKALEQQQRDCNTCKHSDNGNCAYTEECHECMWKSKYEQQPCEDAISRESVIKWLKDKDIIKMKNQEENARRELAELPSVTPTRPTARWERFAGDYNKCSKCGKLAKFYFNYEYCPGCGAKMQEVEE